MSGSGNKHRHEDFHRGFAKGGLLTASGTDTGTVLAVGADGTVLTADSTASTGLAWSAPSGGASSFGSNSNSVGSANAPGASSSNARADHVHQGVHRLTSNGSNALFEDVNVAAGSGIAVTQSGQTVTVASTGAAVVSLDDLSDVTITSPAAADRLRYNGSTWVNSTLVWRPAMVLDPTSGNYLPVVTGDGDAVMTEA
jgi:hypothetical protein